MARRWTSITRYKLYLLCGGMLFMFSLSMLHSQIHPPCNCELGQVGAKDINNGIPGNAGPLSHKSQIGLDNEAQGAPKGQLETPKPQSVHEDGDHPEWGPHKLAIIVPFRDRFDELLEFVPHMHKYLNMKKIRHRILIMNQADSYRFNRASLINAGYLQSQPDCDYIAMHDVDLLPLNPDLDYSYPDTGPFHVAAPELHPKYHYKTFVGGILLVNSKQFKQLNGLSNNFWGWGREDDEFYVRIKDAGLEVFRPTGITTGLDTFKHAHDRHKRPRDNYRYGSQKKASRQRDRVTGVDTIQYSIERVNQLSIDGAPVSIYNVQLECKLEKTPWCVTPEHLQSMVDIAAGEMNYEDAKKLEAALMKHGLPVKVRTWKDK